jgi:Ca-activated chloride channel homolog
MVSPTIPLYDAEEYATRGYGRLEVSYQNQWRALPLAQVHVSANVCDLIANVTIRQTFQNPYNQPMEATYVFPIAPGAAVCNFNLRVGSRVVQGVVQERQQARQNYDRAIASGHRASLLEQERDDVFTVQVGNLPPGEQVTVEISYSERLPFFEDGKTELRLPMVVSPRYTPGQVVGTNSGSGVTSDTTIVPDASRISPARLPWNVDPGVDLQIEVTLGRSYQSGDPCDLSCSQHVVRAFPSSDAVYITLAQARERLNRDFVLRWQSATQNMRSSLLSFTDTDGQTYGMLNIIPPVRHGFGGAPRDVLFVVDRSGSMNGLKMVSAARACALLLNTLGPRDRFSIQAFDNVVEWMPGDFRDSHFIPASMANIYKGENYLRTITARGGTELNRALGQALTGFAKRWDSIGRTSTLVLLTDGEVSNESQILKTIQSQVGDVRLFTVGIDTAVNSGLLKRLANLGGGTCTLVEPGNRLEDTLATIAQEIGQPVLTGIQIHGADAQIEPHSVAPDRIADVFAGRASTTFLRLNRQGQVRISGRYSDGRRFEEYVHCYPVHLKAISQLWAKSRVTDLEDLFRFETHQRDGIRREIINLAVRHQLLTRFTAFLAVDHAQVVNPGGYQVHADQPVEMPAGWGSAPASLAGPNARLKSLSKISDEQAVGGYGGSFSLAESQRRSSGTAFPHVSRSRGAAVPDQEESLASSNNIRYCSSADNSAAPQAQPLGGLYGSAPSANQSAQGWGGTSSRADEGSGWGGSAGEDQWGAAEVSSTGCWGAPSGGSSDGWTSPPSPPSPSAPSPPAPGSAKREESDSNSINLCKSIGRKLGPSDPDAGRSFSRIVPDDADIGGAVQAFFNAFEQAFQMTESMTGRPVAAILEQLRQRLLQMLAPRQIGMELPQLQRFLRSYAIELIGTLDPNGGTDAYALRTAWQSRRAMFDAVRLEVKKVMSHRFPNDVQPGGEFWENSI